MIAFLGAGNIGTALTLLLGKRAKHIALYSIESEVTDSINTKHQSKYLPGHILPKSVFATNDIATALKGAHFVFITLPTHAVAEVLSLARPHLESGTTIISITKGMDPETLHPLILRQIELMPREQQKRLVLLGGPAIANELAQGQVTQLVAASHHRPSLEAIRQKLSSAQVRIALSEDVVGVGLCSALKNPYAIALGLCDGLQVSTNTKGFIFATALAEMANLVEAAGGKRETVYGIGGAGDLFVSGVSFHGRNRLYGQKLVTEELKDPKKLGFTTVEGITTTISALRLAKKHRLKVPLLEAVQECLSKQNRFSIPFQKFLQGKN